MSYIYFMLYGVFSNILFDPSASQGGEPRSPGRGSLSCLEMRLVAKGCMRAIYIASPVFFSTAHCCYYCHHSAMMQCLLLILILSMPVVKTNARQRATDASCDMLWLCIAGCLWLDLTAHWASNLTTPKQMVIIHPWAMAIIFVRFDLLHHFQLNLLHHIQRLYWWFRLFFQLPREPFYWLANIGLFALAMHSSNAAGNRASDPSPALPVYVDDEFQGEALRYEKYGKGVLSKTLAASIQGSLSRYSHYSGLSLMIL